MSTTINSVLGSATDSISSGNYAAKLATNLTGGVSSIATSVGGSGAPTSVTGFISSAISAVPSAPNLPNVPTIPGVPSLSSIVGQSGITSGNIAGLPSLAPSPTTLTIPIGTGTAGLQNAAKGVSAQAFAAITDSFKKLKSGIPQDLVAIAEKNAKEAAAKDAASVPAGAAGAGKPGETTLGATTGTTPSQNASALNTALTNATSGITGATASAGANFTSSLSASGINPTTGRIASVDAAFASGGIGAATSALSGTVSGLAGQMATTSAGAVSGVASGINALPGGQNTIASVIDKSAGALNSIPGTSSISSSIKSASSALTNGIPGSSSVNPLANASTLSAASISAAFDTKKLDTLKAGGVSLSALAGLGLPASATAQLNAAMSSLSSGGAVPIKLPTVAINTTNRTDLSSQFKALVPSTVPLPEFTGNPATFGKTLSSEEIKKYDAAKSELAKLVDDRLDQNIVTRNAEAAYRKAVNDLPQGDPKIDTLKAVWVTAFEKLAAMDKRILELRNIQQQLTTSPAAKPA